MKIRHEVIFPNELFIWMGFWSKPIFKNQPIPFIFFGYLLGYCSKPCSTLQWIAFFATTWEYLEGGGRFVMGE